MDCCDNHKDGNKKDCCDGGSENKMTEGKSVRIRKKTLMWVVIGMLLIAAIFLTVKATSIGAVTASTSVSGGGVDTTGWTQDQIMNYQMHGVVPTGAGSTTGGAPSQVGGC